MDFTSFIAAHGQWKTRLRAAIDTGKSDASVASAKLDNQCQFGKYFYSLPPHMQSSELGRQVRDKHAAFHAEAARVLGLALSGKKAEAQKAIEMNSDFAKISAELTRLMTDWQRKSAA